MRLQELLGVELPIIQAPMAGVQGRALALAVAGAGALGSLPCAMLSPEAMRAELTAIGQASAAPVNVNFFCHQPPRPVPAIEAAWRAALKPYYRELGLDPTALLEAPSRQPFDDQAADALEPFCPRVVSFHFGLPSAPLLSRVKSWGATVLSSATTVAEARWLAARGADVIIAQGAEAGGHRAMFLSDDVTTQIGTLALVPAIVRAVDLPVIAAGGIVDAHGVAAALALGAAGVQVGTAYLFADEATPSAVHRAALESESAAHTALTNLFTGRPARGIVNRLMRELGPLSALTPAFPLAATAVMPLRAKAESQGSGDFSPLWSGQNVAGCRPAPAAEITRTLAAGLGARS
jgi:nitronate monooxygenase